jgi:O-antigen/teichoic acid export membrane protein
LIAWRRAPLADRLRATPPAVSIKAGRFWKDNLWLNGAGVAAGLTNVGYHVIVARMLGPLNYGILLGLGSLSVVLQAPVSIVTLVYTRRGARPGEVGRLNLLWLLVGVALWVVLWLAAARIGALFHLPPTLLWVYALTIVPGFAYGLNLGLMQWAARFVWVGSMTVLGAAGRLGSAITVLVRRLGLVGLVAASPVAQMVTTAISWLGAQKSVGSAQREGLAKHGGLINAGWVGVLTLLMVSADVLAAKHALTGHAAGLYSGLTTMGRAPAYFAGAVGTVLLSTAQREPGRARHYLLRSLLLVAVLSLIGVGIYAVLGPFLIRLALGPGFLGLGPHLVLFTGAMGLQALEMVILYYAAARQWTVLTLLGSLGFVAWIGTVWLATSLDALIIRTVWIMAIQALVSLAGLAVLETMRQRREGEAGASSV